MTPPDVTALLARAQQLQRAGHLADSEAAYRQVLALDPANAAAMINRGNVLRSMGRIAEALESYDRCVAANPAHAQAWSNRAVMLTDLRRHAEAVESCDRAIALMAGNAQAHNNRGIALAALGRIAEAIASYDRALSIDATDAGIHNNRALALMAAFRMDEALASADRAVQLRPDFAPGHYTRGSVLKDLGKLDAAVESFDTAARLAPGIPYVDGARLFLRMQLCDWDGLDSLYVTVERGIERGQRMMHPWALLATPAPAALQKRCAEIFVADRWPVIAGPPAPRPNRDRVRLGYLSADFHGHATSYLLAELIELHDRERFEVSGFSFGPPSAGPMRRRLESAFDHFIDVSALSDAQAAALARERGIDIAIDLKGLTQDSRPGIFAQRAAPVQVNYLGHPGTTGTRFIDYIIADATIIPPGAEAHYTERVVRLPGCYQPNDRTRPIDERRPTRAQLGLPEDAFVFCCFNASYKISAGVFAVWMSLMRNAPHAVLWLLRPPAEAIERLRTAASRAGVDPERLVFAPPVDLAAHLSRSREADLFLDTFHCGAHTTASDALWAGVPLVTCIGETFASRVAASLLRALDLPELVAESAQAYEALALELACSPERLAAIRRKLANGRVHGRLFDTPRYTRELEAAYTAML